LEADSRGLIDSCDPSSAVEWREDLVNRLQFLTRLEADGFARWNRDFGAGARISSDAGFPWAHVENSETTQFDAVAGGERLLHALEDGFYG
jgi:hypothetical protein